MDATNSMYFNLASETLLTLVYKYRKKKKYMFFSCETQLPVVVGSIKKILNAIILVVFIEAWFMS